MHENGIRQGAARFNQRVVDSGGLPQDGVLVSVDTLVNLADIGTKAHTSERLGMPHRDQRRTPCKPWGMEKVMDDCWRTRVAPPRHSV